MTNILAIGLFTLSININYVEDKELENEYTKYSFSVNGYNKATEVPVKKKDHLMDALRYIITYMVKYYSVKL